MILDAMAVFEIAKIKKKTWHCQSDTPLSCKHETEFILQDVKKKVNTKIVFDSDNEEDQIAMKMNENKPNSSEGNDLFEEVNKINFIIATGGRACYIVR